MSQRGNSRLAQLRPLQAIEPDYGSRFMPSVDPGVYLYVALADYFERLIKSGALRRHDPLPAEQRLRADFGVSLGTARSAVEELRKRGLVSTVRSKGTFVTYDDTAAEDTDSHTR